MECSANISERCFPASIESVDDFHAWFGSILCNILSIKSEKHKQNLIMTAVHEAYVNVIRHAYEVDQIGDVVINISLTETSLVVAITDHGKSFDVNGVCQPDFSGKSYGGFGCFIIKKIATEVSYCSRSNGSNDLLLEFNFDMIE